jgi:hypothetical protein
MAADSDITALPENNARMAPVTEGDVEIIKDGPHQAPRKNIV